MSKNLLAVCGTTILIVFIWCAHDVEVERVKGEHVRNLLRLQQAVGQTEQYLKPSIEVSPTEDTNKL